MNRKKAGILLENGQNVISFKDEHEEILLQNLASRVKTNDSYRLIGERVLEQEDA